jgi:hypothetical protein
MGLRNYQARGFETWDEEVLRRKHPLRSWIRKQNIIACGAMLCFPASIKRSTSLPHPLGDCHRRSKTNAYTVGEVDDLNVSMSNQEHEPASH